VLNPLPLDTYIVGLKRNTKIHNFKRGITFWRSLAREIPVLKLANSPLTELPFLDPIYYVFGTLKKKIKDSTNLKNSYFFKNFKTLRNFPT
jgi:hypothetical protein